MERSTREILYDARQQLRTAYIGLEMMDSPDRGRSLAGLRNVAVFGRSVTFILQNLRKTEPAFEDWYQLRVDEMRNDELCRFFVDLRNTIEKAGDVPVRAGRFHIRSFNFPADMSRLPPAPPNAKGMFMGDQAGRSGWEVQMPDGSTERFYFDLPEEIGGPSRLQFPNPPKSHRGEPLSTAEIKILCELYIAYLEELVQSTERQFLS